MIAIDEDVDYEKGIDLSTISKMQFPNNLFAQALNTPRASAISIIKVIQLIVIFSHIFLYFSVYHNYFQMSNTYIFYSYLKNSQIFIT